MVKYRFDLLRGGVKKAELVEVDNIRFGYIRNGFKKAIFTHNADRLDPILYDNLIEGSELQIYRQGEFQDSLRLIWAGELQEPTKTKNTQNVKTYNIEVENWGNVFLTSRFVTKTFTSEEEEDISWGIINDTQTNTFGGTFTADQVNWGITQGVLEVTNNTRDRTYVDGQVLQLLQQLADVKDRAGNPDRVRGFRLSPTLTRSAYHEFTYHANYGVERNITLTDIQFDNVKEKGGLKNYANRIVATGATEQKIANSTDTEALNFYKMRQAFRSKNNIKTATELQEAADGELLTAEQSLGKKFYAFVLDENNVFTGEYECGDILNIQMTDDDGFIIIDSQFQVYEIDITFNSSGIETTQLKVSETKPQNLDFSIEEQFVMQVVGNNSRITELEK